LRVAVEGWAAWSLEPTCQTARSTRCRRKDQVGISCEIQARLLEVHVGWASGLKTNALQRGVFAEGEPDRFQSWTLVGSGPEDKEQGFTNEEFEDIFARSWAAWQAASFPA
jgi:hypothetical protein